MMPFRYLGLVALAATVGCGKVVVDQEVEETSDVTGSWIDVWVTESGDIELAHDLRGSVAAVVANEYGTRTYKGTGFEDGTFVVHSVPADRPFLLSIKAADSYFSFYYTEERHVDLGKHRAGRPNAWTGEAAATLLVDVDGLDPWTTSDLLLASSYSADGSTLALGGAAIEPGATDAQGLEMSWFAGGKPDASKGDVTHWIQARGEQGPLGLEVRTVVAHAVQNDLSLAPDETHEVQISLTKVAADTFDAWDIRAGEFASLAEADPLIDARQPEFSVGATPEPRFAATSSGCVVLSGERPTTGDVDFKVETAYGDPYPEAWGRVAQFTLNLAPKLPSDGAGSPNGIPMFNTSSLPIELARSGPIRPRLGAVRNLRLDGESCADPITVHAWGPVLAWDPPELGTPVVYGVATWRLDGGTFVFNGGALTSLTELPYVDPGKDGTYVFTVRASASPELSAAAPNELPLPADTATTLTNLVTFSEGDQSQ